MTLNEINHLSCEENLVDVVVVRSANSVIYDPRVKKIVDSLSKKYKISVLGWNRDGISQEKINNYKVELELFNLRTSTWKPSFIRIITRLIIFFPPFWTWVFIKLLSSRPKVVHACDLDTIFPSYLYKIIFRRKLVFDVFDRYAMTFVPQKFGFLYKIINFAEELFSEHSDVLLIANGESALRSFKKKPGHYEILFNYPEDHFADVSQHFKKNNPFSVAFTGHIRKHKGLEALISVLRDLDDIQLIITGRTEDKELLKEIQASPNIKYLGLVDDSELLEIVASSNIMTAFYDPVFFSNNMPLPNKIFEAMMCSTPIITNVAPEIVNESECGLIVEYNNEQQIKEAIITLKDNPPLCKRLGDNGRKAFDEKYNWGRMEQKLYKVYESLLPYD